MGNMNGNKMTIANVEKSISKILVMGSIVQNYILRSIVSSMPSSLFNDPRY